MSEATPPPAVPRLNRLLALLLGFTIALLGFPVITVVNATPAAAATPGCDFADQGGNGSYRDRICWINLADFTATSVNSGSGQSVTQTLPGGFTLTLNLRRTSGTTTAGPSATPTWSNPATGEGAAIGNTAYLGIDGRPVWYITAGRSTSGETYRVSAVSLRGPTGTVIDNFALIAADGESTDAVGNAREAMRFTVGGGGGISVLENVAAASGNTACTGGLTQTSTYVDCVGGVSNPGALLVQTPYRAGMTLDVRTIRPNEGAQGFMFGIYLPTVTLRKNINGLVNASDAFTIRATPTGGTPISATTSGANSATTGSAMGFIGGSVVLDEIGANAGTDLTRYARSWSCSNTYAGSATVLPPEGSTGTSVSISPTTANDNITCILTNTAPPPAVSIVKSASVTSFSAAGQPINYTFNVTNSGGQTLSGVRVTDPLTGLSAVSCPATSLAPGASMTCTATYTTRAADVTAAQVANTASVTGTTPTSQTVTASSTRVTVPYVASSASSQTSPSPWAPPPPSSPASR